MAHRTLTRPSGYQEVVKGSRFRALVAPLARPEEVVGWVARLRSDEPDANHVAWAWRWGEERRWSDDGEPGGSAGRPMLEVLLKRDVDRCVALVARQFGGVKLGVGGLARAYGGAVAHALDAAEVVEVADRRDFEARAPFADTDALLRLLSDPAVEHGPPSFTAAGAVVTGSVLADEAVGLVERAADATRGRVAWAWRQGATEDAAACAGQRK